VQRALGYAAIKPWIRTYTLCNQPAKAENALRMTFSQCESQSPQRYNSQKRFPTSSHDLRCGLSAAAHLHCFSMASVGAAERRWPVRRWSKS